MEQRVAYSRSSSGVKRFLPAQAEERMQCAGVAVAFRACLQAKRAESSCSGALYPALGCHALGGAASGTPEECGAKVLLFVCAWGRRLAVEQSGVARHRKGRKLPLYWRSCTQGRHAGCCGGACMSEGGTPLSRQSAGLPALLLQYAAHAAARRWSRKLRSEAELHTARGGEAMRLADGLLLKTKAFLYSSALFFPY